MTPVRTLSLGWGVQSWTLAAMSALGELPPLDYAIHADTTHELAETYAHAAAWTPWLEGHGVKVRTVKANRPDVLREDWGDSGAVLIPAFTKDQRKGKMGMTRRQCTHAWKVMPIRRFVREILVFLSAIFMPAKHAAHGMVKGEGCIWKLITSFLFLFGLILSSLLLMVEPYV